MDTPNTCRELLDVIDAFLIQHAGDGESANVWAVLTGLRGPDVTLDTWERTLATKLATAVQVRAKAFPKLVKAAAQTLDLNAPTWIAMEVAFVRKDWRGCGGGIVSPGLTTPNLNAALAISDHFHGHMQMAFEVLDIPVGATLRAGDTVTIQGVWGKN